MCRGYKKHDKKRLQKGGENGKRKSYKNNLEVKVFLTQF